MKAKELNQKNKVKATTKDRRESKLIQQGNILKVLNQGSGINSSKEQNNTSGHTGHEEFNNSTFEIDQSESFNSSDQIAKNSSPKVASKTISVKSPKIDTINEGSDHESDEEDGDDCKLADSEEDKDQNLINEELEMLHIPSSHTISSIICSTQDLNKSIEEETLDANAGAINNVS